MNRITAVITLGTFALVGHSHAQTIPGNWTGTWSDEFNTGASDLNGWTRQTGAGGWGNQELETYTSSSNNAFVSTDTSTGIGALTVRAIANGTGGYTSARLNTSANLFSQANGLFEFRAKLPAGQGLWPAVWMMPQNPTGYGNGWPTSGEIDMLESTGQDTKLVQGSLHSGADSGSQYTQTKTFQSTGLQPANFTTTDWHTYDVEWDAGTASSAATFKFFVDGTLYQTIHGGWYLPSNKTSPSSPFDKPFYLLINMAVGGTYVGAPSLAAGNYDMQIDYFRAFSGTAPEPTSLGLLGLAALALRRRR